MDVFTRVCRCVQCFQCSAPSLHSAIVLPGLTAGVVRPAAVATRGPGLCPSKGCAWEKRHEYRRKLNCFSRKVVCEVPPMTQLNPTWEATRASCKRGARLACLAAQHRVLLPIPRVGSSKWIYKAATARSRGGFPFLYYASRSVLSIRERQHCPEQFPKGLLLPSGAG